MSIIDDRGRLLGRVNLLDVAVVLAVVVLVPMGYVAFRIFRTPSPVITAVTPSTLAIDSPRRIRLTGEHFRPYLGAFVAKTDEPYSVVNRLPNTQQATFLIETPTLVELALPPVGPGTYDIHLYDEAQEVAKRTAAFTIAQPRAAVISALVWFAVPAEMVPALDSSPWSIDRVGTFVGSPVGRVSSRAAAARTGLGWSGWSNSMSARRRSEPPAPNSWDSRN